MKARQRCICKGFLALLLTPAAGCAGPIRADRHLMSAPDRALVPGHGVGFEGSRRVVPRAPQYQELELNASGRGRRFSAQIDQPARRGLNSLWIHGLPRGTRVISVWVTQWRGEASHAEPAVRFDTESVQLYNDGSECRVLFTVECPRTQAAHPAGVMVMAGEDDLAMTARRPGGPS